MSHIQGRGRACYAAADARRTGLPGCERAVRLTNDLRVIGVTGRHRRHQSWTLAVIVAVTTGRHPSRHQSWSLVVISRVAIGRRPSRHQGHHQSKSPGGCHQNRHQSQSPASSEPFTRRHLSRHQSWSRTVVGSEGRSDPALAESDDVPRQPFVRALWAGTLHHWCVAERAVGIGALVLFERYISMVSGEGDGFEE